MKTDVFLKTKKQQLWHTKQIACFILAITAASDALCARYNLKPDSSECSSDSSEYSSDSYSLLSSKEPGNKPPLKRSKPGSERGLVVFDRLIRRLPNVLLKHYLDSLPPDSSKGISNSNLNSSASTLSRLNLNTMPPIIINEIASKLNFNDTNALRLTSPHLADILTPLQTDRLIARYQKILPGLVNYDNSKRLVNCTLYEYIDNKKYYFDYIRSNDNVDLRTITPPYVHLLDTDDPENSVQQNSADDKLLPFRKNVSIIENFKKNISKLLEKIPQSKVKIIWIPLRFYCHEKQIIPRCKYDMNIECGNLFKMSNGKYLSYLGYSKNGKIYGYIHDLEHPETVANNTNSFLLVNSSHRSALSGVFLNLADGRLLIHNCCDNKTQIFSQDPLDPKNNSVTVLTEDDHYGYSHIIQLDDGRLLAAPDNNLRWRKDAGQMGVRLEILDPNQPGNSTGYTILLEIDEYQRLASKSTRCLMQLSDGRVLVSTDYGIITKDINEPEDFRVDGLSEQKNESCFVIEMDNGHLLATHGKTLIVWDITKPKNWCRVATLEGHKHNILTIMQIPDGRLISADDYHMKIWDLGQPEAERCVKTIYEPNQFNLIKLLADGRLLYTNNSDGIIKILDLNLPKDNNAFAIELYSKLLVDSVVQLDNGLLAVSHARLLRIWDLYHAPAQKSDKKNALGTCE